MQKGERVNVRVTSNKPLKAVPVDDDEIAGYWGYSVARAGSLSRALTLTPGLRIATSRYGESIDADLLRKIPARSGNRDGPARGSGRCHACDTEPGVSLT